MHYTVLTREWYIQEKVKPPWCSSTPDIWGDTLIKAPEPLLLPDAFHAVQNSTVFGSHVQPVTHCSTVKSEACEPVLLTCTLHAELEQKTISVKLIDLLINLCNLIDLLEIIRNWNWFGNRLLNIKFLPQKYNFY